MSERHAVILAGGKGARLRPYTTTFPKPLVPIGDDCAILDIVLRQLARDQFTRVTLAIGHLGALVRAYVGSGEQWGLDVDYVHEGEPLGTIGPVIAILDRLPEHFLVLNGDILTDLRFSWVLDEHALSNAPITVATYRRDAAIDFGVLELDGTEIVGFKEKPLLHYDVSMGVYALSRSALTVYEPGQRLGFDELMLDLLRDGQRPRAQRHEGYWLDIGRPEDYDRANAEFADRRASLLGES
jgi:mannose-1-phosphate guanylyltransferase